jgi:hypothetical protein
MTLRPTARLLLPLLPRAALLLGGALQGGPPSARFQALTPYSGARDPTCCFGRIIFPCGVYAVQLRGMKLPPGRAGSGCGLASAGGFQLALILSGNLSFLNWPTQPRPSLPLR